MEKIYLSDMLKAHGNAAKVRFSMPGHHGKKSDAFFDEIAHLDVTEINATDDLYSPKKNGPVENSLKRLGENLKCSAVYLTGGATLALQGGIFLALKKLGTNKVICDRRMHISVVNTLMLLKCEIRWLLPNEDLCHSPEDLENIIKSVGKCAVIITSPDYYGRMQNISALAEITHKYSSLLICDNAHGAHFAFFDKEKHPKMQGADICADSFHKTLPALTGAAVLYSDFPIDEMLNSVKIFASTSPSYVIAASIDRAVEFALEHQDKFESLLQKIDEFKKNCEKIGYFFPKYTFSDSFRICVSHSDFDMRDAYAYLEKSGVFCEFADCDNLIIIPSPLDTDTDFSALYSALDNFLKFQPKIKEKREKFVPLLPKKALSLWDAAYQDGEKIKVEDAKGYISLRSLYPYPPGIPVICAGEIIDENVQKILINSGIYEITAKKI